MENIKVAHAIFENEKWSCILYIQSRIGLLVIIDKQTAVKPEEPDHLEDSNSTESNTSQKNETTEKDKSTKNESTNTAAIYNALFYKGLLVVSLVAGFVLVVVKRKSC